MEYCGCTLKSSNVTANINFICFFNNYFTSNILFERTARKSKCLVGAKDDQTKTSIVSQQCIRNDDGVSEVCDKDKAIAWENFHEMFLNTEFT